MATISASFMDEQQITTTKTAAAGKKAFYGQKTAHKSVSAGSTRAREREPALISDSTFAPFIPLLPPPLIEHYVRIIKP